MNKVRSIGKIFWTEEKIRKNFFKEGERLGAITKFDDQDNAWSIVCTFLGICFDANCHLAIVEFLVNEAPHERLSTGNSIDLLDGNKLIAKVEIIAQLSNSQ